MSADIHFGRIERRQMRRVRNVFFVGIGGVGMSAIAEVLITLGYAVFGFEVVRQYGAFAGKGRHGVFRPQCGECR